MDPKEVERTLINIAQEEGLEDIDLWPRIRERVSTLQKAKQHLLPRTRIGWAALITLFLLLSSTVAFAVDFISHRAIQEDPGLEYAQLKGRGQEINLVSTSDGITVNLQWVYADTNRVALGFSIHGPPSVTYNNISPVRMALTDDRGNIYPSFNGFGTPYEKDSTGFVASFTVPPAAKPLPAILKLRLAMFTLAIDPTMIDQLPTPAPGEPKEDALSNQLLGPYVGPFTFAFDIIPQPTSFKQLGQVVEAAGVRLTLKSISISPSETQAELCYDGPDIQDWAPVFHLDVGIPIDWAQVSPGSLPIPGTACRMLYINAPLFDQKGTWTLTVSEIVGLALDGSNDQKRIIGPWIFKFER